MHDIVHRKHVQNHELAPWEGGGSGGQEERRVDREARRDAGT